MLSHLCCLMNVEVTLFTVILYHVNPSFLGSSLCYVVYHCNNESTVCVRDACSIKSTEMEDDTAIRLSTENYHEVHGAV